MISGENKPKLSLLHFNENPNIGIYCRTNDSVVFLQQSLPKKTKQLVGKILDVKVIELCIADSTIIGSLLTCNSSGAVVTAFATKETLRTIEQQGLRVFPVKDVINAAGNDILANDYGALVHPELKVPRLSKSVLSLVSLFKGNDCFTWDGWDGCGCDKQRLPVSPEDRPRRK